MTPAGRIELLLMQGLVRLLSGLDWALPLQRTQLQFPASRFGSLQPVAPAAGDSMVLLGPLQAPALQTCTHMQLGKREIKSLKKKINN